MSVRRASNVSLRKETGTDRDLYASWSLNATYMNKPTVQWLYYTSDGKSWIGNQSHMSSGPWYSTYTAPDNAVSVRFGVKPTCKKSKDTAGWVYKYINLTAESELPSTPDEPSVEFSQDKSKVVISVEGISEDDNTNGIRFELYSRERSSYDVSEYKLQANYDVDVANTVASIVLSDLSNKYDYRVRAKAFNDHTVKEIDTSTTKNKSTGAKSLHSTNATYWSEDWSGFTEINMPPSPPDLVYVSNIKSSTEVTISWGHSVGIDDVVSLPNGTETTMRELLSKGQYNSAYADLLVSNNSLGFTYELGYVADDVVNFDYGKATSVATGIETLTYPVELSETGRHLFFKVKSTDGSDTSEWSDAYADVYIGLKPSIPTTWSSTTKAMRDSTVTLYWAHNSNDSSNEYGADIIVTDGEGNELVNTHVDKEQTEEALSETSHYAIDLSETIYSGLSYVNWKIRTYGIIETPSDWSVQRQITINDIPSVSIKIDDVTTETGPYNETRYVLGSFPINTNIVSSGGTPISYLVELYSGEQYSAQNAYGENVVINANSKLYSKVIDSNDLSLDHIISASDVILEDNVNYILSATVFMSSGLSANASVDFYMVYEETDYYLDADIYTSGAYGVYITPYLLNKDPYTYDDEGNPTGDSDAELVSGATLSIYRMEVDGTFTTLIEDMDNTRTTRYLDPYPSLDYGRYRISATDSTTGQIYFEDLPFIEIGCKKIIIQWNGETITTDALTEDDLDTDAPERIIYDGWVGNILELPYNNDVSDTYSPDVELVKYAGRSNPVSYYGTQDGLSSTWSVDIDKKDSETLNAIRKLAIYKGDCYVRESTGMGYWAQISVSYTMTHAQATVPISLTVTKVDGGD